MNTLLKIISLLFPLIFSGCPSFITSHPAPRSESLKKPIEISVDGDFHHSSSGMMFPQIVEGFVRTGITQYDKEGYNISVGYNAYGLLYNLISTIYVYPGPEMNYLVAAYETVSSLESGYLSSELGQTKRIIEEEHPDWKLEYEGESPLKQSYPGVMASYRFQQDTLVGSVKVESSVHIFLVDHKWFVKFRFTCPEAGTEQYTPSVFNLVKSITWPGE